MVAIRKLRRITEVESRRVRLQLTARLEELRDRLDRAVAEARNLRMLITEASDGETDGFRRVVRKQISRSRRQPRFSHT